MSSSGRTVLVADDDEFVRAALRSVLTRELDFARVVEAVSLDEALQRLGEEKGISLALFDLKMPGVENAASLAAVRECFPDLCVAVVSGSSRREDILLALWAGVHGYVPKTLGLKELAHALRTVLSGTVYVPASLAKVGPGDGVGPPPDMKGRNAGTIASVSPALTPRQQDVLRLLTKGKTNKEIARALDLGIGTVKIHLAAVFRALGVTTRAAAAAAGAKLLAE
jgi:DNA-binding NarL/FixJ family response regulator